MKKPRNAPENQGQRPKTPNPAPARRKKISAAPGEFRASTLESSRSPEDGRDD